jgi:DNA-binding response OmpR family regulator
MVMALVSKTANAVLILEKDRDLANSIRVFLEDVYQVYIIDDPSELVSHIRRYGIKLLVTDLDYANADLQTNLHNIRSSNPGVKIILMYMFLDDDNQKSHSILKEADDYIFKPFDADVFRYKVDKLLS